MRRLESTVPLCLAPLVLLLAVWQSACQPATTRDAKPLFAWTDSQLSAAPTIVAYGDMRFTDPKETTATNPTVRRWLVDRVAAETPDAILLSGDVPWHGGEAADYAQFRLETESWRKANLRVLPALGNHELEGPSLTQCLENWWSAFPALRGRRWYSARLGSRIAVLSLDSNSSLLPASDQQRWIAAQLANLDPAVRFVFLNLHHPPVADFQEAGDTGHNPRPNEIALAAFLKDSPVRSRVRFIVCAGHVHNYERFLRDGIAYLVSGGAGAAPQKLVRAPDDLYQDPAEANYHYVKFVLRGSALEASMVRVADPAAETPRWEVKDSFRIPATE